jgi:hypothetical protein
VFDRLVVMVSLTRVESARVNSAMVDASDGIARAIMNESAEFIYPHLSYDVSLG